MIAQARVRVLDEDPDLGGALEGRDLAEARHVAVAPVVAVEGGPWQPFVPDNPDATLGLLVLDGLLTRTVVVEDRAVSELLGAGDILRPWQEADELASVPTAARWDVLAPGRLAVLDGAFSAAVARWPQIGCALLARTMQRARSLAFQLAVCHIVRIERRVMMILWSLADRWGKVDTDGVVLTTRLTHAMIARMVGSRRPTVTTAFARLEQEGALRRRADGALVLLGSPPAGYGELQRSTAG